MESRENGAKIVLLFGEKFYLAIFYMMAWSLSNMVVRGPQAAEAGVGAPETAEDGVGAPDAAEGGDGALEAAEGRVGAAEDVVDTTKDMEDVAIRDDGADVVGQAAHDAVEIVAERDEVETCGSP